MEQRPGLLGLSQVVPGGTGAWIESGFLSMGGMTWRAGSGDPQEEPRPCAFETPQRCARVARALGGAPQRWVFSQGRWVRAGGCSHEWCGPGGLLSRIRGGSSSQVGPRCWRQACLLSAVLQQAWGRDSGLWRTAWPGQGRCPERRGLDLLPGARAERGHCVGSVNPGPVSFPSPRCGRVPGAQRRLPAPVCEHPRLLLLRVQARLPSPRGQQDLPG